MKHFSLTITDDGKNTHTETTSENYNLFEVIGLLSLKILELQEEFRKSLKNDTTNIDPEE